MFWFKYICDINEPQDFTMNDCKILQLKIVKISQLKIVKYQKNVKKRLRKNLRLSKKSILEKIDSNLSILDQMNNIII